MRSQEYTQRVGRALRGEAVERSGHVDKIAALAAHLPETDAVHIEAHRPRDAHQQPLVRRAGQSSPPAGSDMGGNPHPYGRAVRPVQVAPGLGKDHEPPMSTGL